MFVDELAQSAVLFGSFIDRADGQREVGAGKATDLFEGISQPQHLADVAADHGCGGGGEGNALWTAELLQGLAESQVIRTEIVTPLAQAVGFVDSEE